MFSEFKNHISYLHLEQEKMNNLLEKWVSINSGSDNLEGLEEMHYELGLNFAQFGVKVEKIAVPPRLKVNSLGNFFEQPTGYALRIIQRPELPRRFFVGGHMDTVFHASCPFQSPIRLTDNILQGPGAADMKGGLLIMLKSLEAFEKSPWASQVGWDLLITADEEVGSKSSEHLILESASRCQAGFIFEPSFSDGNLVSARKGSMNYSAVAKGKSAHAGRDFHQGRNAIVALTRFITAADALNNNSGTITVNIGSFEGGGAVNIVPDLATCRLNIRAETTEELLITDKLLKEIVVEINETDGIQIEIYQDNFRSSKPFDSNTQKLFDTLHACGHQLSMDLHWRPSGGVCDGNILALAGVPCIDTLGAVGGGIHTYDEYVELDSLPKRAMLSALMMMHFANV